MGVCFVIMPFSGYFNGYYKNVIKKTVSKTGLLPRRADEIYGTSAVIDEIHKEILNSDICIADVTGRNPNVIYELGIAHAVNKPVIIITQDIEDVPFDYKHLRVIKYDPKSSGWEDQFCPIIEKTIKEVQKNPGNNIALKNVQDDKKRVHRHLKNIFYATSYDFKKINEIFCNENGNALIKSSWFVLAKSPIYHLCQNFVADKPGNIEVLRVYDKISARELDYAIIEKSNVHLTLFLLLKQFKKRGQHFEIETEVSIDGYIDFENLFKTGKSILSNQAAEQRIRYLRKEDHLYLPKNKNFAQVYAEYLNHPQKEKVGEHIKPIETKGHYLLKLIYSSDDDQPYQQETGVAICVPNK
jgi:nucleoside 2-deoxyribosyltransferase